MSPNQPISGLRRRDALGVLHALEAPAGRIVSLVPSITETLHHLGAGAQLVGVTDWCVHPADQVAALAKVGGTKSPDLEAIRALNPDLVLANIEENRREDIERLAADTRVFVTFPRTLPETMAHVRDLGALTGRNAGAERLVRAIEDALGAAHRHRVERAPVPFLYLIWRKPYWAAGGECYIDALLTAAGGRNVAESPRYYELEDGWIRACAAQLVIFPSEPLPFSAAHLDEFARTFPELPAVQKGRLHRASGEDLSWFGARTPAGLRLAAELLGGALPTGL